MKIGIVGAGNIGSLVAKKLDAAGHQVKLANSRGPESLADTVAGTGIQAVEREEAVLDADVVILSVPSKNPDLATILAGAPAGAIVVDTSNYYPTRDSKIFEVDSCKPETVWVSEQVGRPLVKAWNALLAQTLAAAGLEAGAPGRIAIPLSGDDAAAKALVSDLISVTGFDTGDAGTLEESWRLQPGTPAYCTELTAHELKAALTAADRKRAPSNRDAIMASFSKPDAEFTRAAAVATNRSLSA
ncbi:3-hydroxyisobutyrate dehydrogenase [Mesorhizobium sp. L103C119B0]|uniref:NADPH-dependent F420 reductase n=1 Tax=Mesorhizobium sp. L103C119B0 TaxID=1287085 RepID=UPI0003CFF4FC|nr:NAD(P)-binding domain-containing protein [Mesorhizobium sp. L103C119B0]ESZ54991.1 3-hydroxyisobutyrate dehydrogenase [Mesorhizobium sp. L103C119B0]